ncbi:MAG: IS200/IS605 family transposase [Phycisphaerales bacterium]|nr:IS200/IS605 family transposase [Phycisphaerales bacterium]
MPQSYTCCHYHIVFSTKGRARLITDNVRDRLYAYMAGIVHGLDGQVLGIGGTGDHVHLLLQTHVSRAIADVMRELKACSSKWMHEEVKNLAFAWQPGYGAFTVSYSNVEDVRRYIANQEAHHRKMSFDEELERLCARHGIVMDVRTSV